MASDPNGWQPSPFSPPRSARTSDRATSQRRSWPWHAQVDRAPERRETPPILTRINCTHTYTLRQERQNDHRLLYRNRRARRQGFQRFLSRCSWLRIRGQVELEAVENAEEALSLHLAEMVRAGEAIPERSATIPHDPEVEEFCRFIARVELPGKAVRLNITMDEGLVAAIDRVTANRSSFLAEAARLALAKRREAA